MSRTIATTETVEVDVEVECDELHCIDGDCPPCDACGGDGLAYELERLWAQHGPEDERFCRLEATQVEPWRSLADIAYGRVRA